MYNCKACSRCLFLVASLWFSPGKSVDSVFPRAVGADCLKVSLESYRSFEAFD